MTAFRSAATIAIGSVVAVAAVVVAVVMPAPTASASLSAAVPPQFAGLIQQAAEDCPGLPAAVLAAQLRQESGFNPDAVSAAGAAGIAQFMPGTWVTWGQDADGNGTTSPFDPADAIDAQGRFMCDLFAKAQGSGLPGDPVQLALAGYNAGWGAVLQYGGVPPFAETQQYVRTITANADTFRVVNAGGSFGDGAGAFALPRANARTPAEAIAWAQAAVNGPQVWYRRCLNFVAQSYGWGSAGTQYAIDHYRVTMPAGLRHDGDRNPPPGALMFWDTGGRAGHVALYLGGGLIASNDIVTQGAISVVPASEIERKWGATYVGWAPPYFPNAG